MEFGDPRRRHPLSAGGDSYAVLRGVSPERSRLALQAIKIYYLTIYRERAGSDRALYFLEATAEEMALADGFDIFHEIIGEDILRIYANYSPRTINEFGGLLGVAGIWEDIVGRSIFGIEGSPGYAVSIAQNRVLLENAIAEFQAAIALDNVSSALNKDAE